LQEHIQIKQTKIHAKNVLLERYQVQRVPHVLPVVRVNTKTYPNRRRAKIVQKTLLPIKHNKWYAKTVLLEKNRMLAVQVANHVLPVKQVLRVSNV
jgi:hypothetical protein